MTQTNTKVQFTPINAPSTSKGWNRYQASVNGSKLVESATGNAWVSSPKSAEIEAGTVITLIAQTMRRVGKARTARENVETETYTLIAEPGASCTPGSRLVDGGSINGVKSPSYLVGGVVTVEGARLA
jgi:hypothetical protein